MGKWLKSAVFFVTILCAMPVFSAHFPRTKSISICE